MIERTYYEILRVEESATQEEIKEAYRFLAQSFHPDKHSTDKNKQKGTKLIQEINAAYEILKDPDKRRQYDEELRRIRDRWQGQSHTGAQASTESCYRRPEEMFGMPESVYEILGIKESASQREIKEACRSLLTYYKEERNLGMVKAVEEIYWVLGDPDRRRRYNKALRRNRWWRRLLVAGFALLGASLGCLLPALWGRIMGFAGIAGFLLIIAWKVIRRDFAIIRLQFITTVLSTTFATFLIGTLPVLRDPGVQTNLQMFSVALRTEMEYLVKVNFFGNILLFVVIGGALKSRLFRYHHEHNNRDRKKVLFATWGIAVACLVLAVAINVRKYHVVELFSLQNPNDRFSYSLSDSSSRKAKQTQLLETIAAERGISFAKEQRQEPKRQKPKSAAESALRNNLSGEWEGSMRVNGVARQATLRITDSLSGVMICDGVEEELDVTIDNGQITLTGKSFRRVSGKGRFDLDTFHGTISANGRSMTGSFRDAKGVSGQWSVVRTNAAKGGA